MKAIDTIIHNLSDSYFIIRMKSKKYYAHDNCR